MLREPVLWGLNRRTSTKLDEAHFKDALKRMEESGVSVSGKEDEPSVSRIIKTVTGEDSSDESLSDIYASSNESLKSDYSGSDILDEEKLAAQKLLKDLKKKKEKPFEVWDVSESRRYLSWLEKEKKSLRLDGYTAKDGATRKKKKDKNDDEELEILSSESEPSDKSIDTSEVESDPDDPFSQTPEGKDIMRKMKKIKTSPKRGKVEESDLKRKMKETATDGHGFRPFLDVTAIHKPPVEWCSLTKAQAESRNSKGWIGEVKDIESLWFRDICEESERERRKSGGPVE